MNWTNPIIHKELIQSSHRKRTYLLRAGLPALAALILVPQLSFQIRYAGQDWRVIAGVTRAIFHTCAWLELSAFSIVAYLAAATAIQGEWTRKTIEVLCASPLGTARIVVGKFVAVLSAVVMLALSMLPIMGIWYYLGRMPPEMVLGAFAVILGSTVFCGGVALAQAAAFRPGRGGGIAAWTAFVVPYFLVVILVDAFVFQGTPVLDAAIPVYALGLVLNARPPGGMTMGDFALLSLVVNAGVGLLALAVAPALFRRTFAAHIGSAARSRLWARLRERLRKRRPPLGGYDNPLYWQERGAYTAILRRGPWIVAAIFVVVCVAAGLAHDFRYVDDEEFHAVAAVGGLVTLAFFAALYGAIVFAREKAWRTADALLLTGNTPRRFLFAKLKAVYRGLFWPLAVVAVLCGTFFFRFLDDLDKVAEVLAVLLLLGLPLCLGPAVAALVGMNFSPVARTPVRAVLGLFATILWLVLFGILGGIIDFYVIDEEWWVLFFLVAVGLVFGLTRRWRLWKLSAFLALCILLFVFATVTTAGIVNRGTFNGYDTEFFVTVVCASAYALFLAGLWWWNALRVFEAGMSGADRRRRRSRVRRRKKIG